MGKSKQQEVQRKVAPNAVRVSYFYKALSFTPKAESVLSQEKRKKAPDLAPGKLKFPAREVTEKARKLYRDRLGEQFIPAWTQLTAPLGLTAYIPSVPARMDAVPQVPDEVAVVFFESQRVYNHRNETVGGRVCGTTLHNCVFAFDDPCPVRKSNTDFPKLMPAYGKEKLNYTHEFGKYTPYHLFKNKADWYFGETDLFVGVRPDKLTSDQFAALVQKHLDALRNDRPKGLEGLLFIILQDCFIYWAHWAKDEPGQQKLLEPLRKSMKKVTYKRAKPATIPPSLSQPFKGLKVNDDTSFAIRFQRR